MKLTKSKLIEASVPSNIAQFAKRKGVMPLVNKVAKWAESSGKRVVGGTAIGKGYSTLVLDLTHNGSEVYIDLDDETISVNGEDVFDLKSFKRALELKENEAMKLTKSQLREIIKETITELDENPCWDGYVAYGTKMKDGKEVPNCVPVSEANVVRALKEGDSEYQAYFRKELEKTGKSSPADMTDDEKKAFFTKVDKGWSAKTESFREGLSPDIAKHMIGIYKGFIKVEDDGVMIYDSPSNAAKAAKYLNSKEIAALSDGKYLYIESINEGNAFGAAVTQAKKEGKKEFEFNGKKYKVKKGSYEKNEAKKEYVTEGRKSKDSVGLRYAEAVHNNAASIIDLVVNSKIDPKDVIETMGSILLNAINATLKHNYKPNPAPIYTTKRDLKHYGDYTNEKRIGMFKDSLTEMKKIVEDLIKKPSKVGVKRLNDAHRNWWNWNHGADVVLNGKHGPTIIQ